MPGTVCLTFDLDAVALWIDTFRTRSPSAISRGEYGPDVGVPRILAMLARQAVPATFFIPGSVAELYADTIRLIQDHGHELASHGDNHRLLPGLGIDEERRTLEQGIARLAAVTGQQPLGFRAPAWELSFDTVDLLTELGIRYDSSLFGSDYHPYRARRGDGVVDGQWTRGETSDIWEFPIAWELDDVPYFMVHPPAFGGGADPAVVRRIWEGELDYMIVHEPDGIFTLTMHPQVIGRGPRVQMLERFVEHAGARGCEFTTLATAYNRLENL